MTGAGRLRVGIELEKRVEEILVDLEEVCHRVQGGGAQPCQAPIDNLEHTPRRDAMMLRCQ